MYLGEKCSNGILEQESKIKELIAVILEFLYILLRKPADGLGKVVFANEVSIGGMGWGGCPRLNIGRW